MTDPGHSGTDSAKSIPCRESSWNDFQNASSDPFETHRSLDRNSVQF